jgi:hypothetical protein
MSTLVVETEPRATEVFVTEDELIVRLVDGRTVSAPLVWFTRLLNAAPEQRRNWELLGDGEIIHWPEIDEDLSVAGLLRGTPLPRPRAV